MELTDLTNMKISGLTDRYVYNGIKVPRVTEIISKMIHEDYLMGWANHLGFKRQSYKEVLKKAGDIGEQSHSAIEMYLKKKEITNNIPLEGFMIWWNQINKGNTVSIIGQEQRLVCEYFGGTYDLLLNINGLIYIVDFKTSNHLSYKYCLQLAAYNFMLKKIMKIDGIIILQLNKTTPNFNEVVLDFTTRPQDLEFFMHCENTFLSLVYSYYYVHKAENDYKDLCREKGYNDF